MKNLVLILGTVLIANLTVINANAQSDAKSASHGVSINVEEFALLDIESDESSDITLNPNVPTEAGEGINFENVTNDDLWLNYSSIVANGKKRTISATISTDLPDGIKIKVIADNAVGSSGKGNKGQKALSTPEALSSSSSVTLIQNIGSCYTGDGAGAGSKLTYSVEVDDDNYATIVQKGYSTTVTYTISDNN